MSVNFTIITPPANAQPPRWIGGVHVDFMLQWANSPRILLKQTGPLPCESELWQFDGQSRYWREKDGTMEQLWHSPATIEKEDGWHTGRMDGFGGRRFTIQMQDGRTVHLNGPWFGGQKSGWMEAHTVDMRKNSDAKRPYYVDRPWHERGACFGFYVSDDIVIRALARYAAHLGIAHAQLFDDYWHIEPFKPAWGTVKGNLTREQIEAELAAERTAS